MAICLHLATIRPNGSAGRVYIDGSSTLSASYQVFMATNTDPQICPEVVALSAQEYKDMQLSVSAFGWDEGAFSLAFGAALALFAIGLGIGLVISTLRKARL